MRSRSIHRVLSALLLGWFTVVIGEPAALHSCPMHDAAAPAGMADAHQSHDAHAPSAPADHHGSCTCLGDCSAGSAVSGVPAPPVALANAPWYQHQALLPPVTPATLPAPPYFLPYANGPPGLGIA